MISVAAPILLSDIDKERFGIKTARAAQVTKDTFAYIMEFCCTHNVKFLIARCDADDMKIVQTMEANGFFLTDTLLYYRCNLRNRPTPPVSPGIVIRPSCTGDEEVVKTLASEAFRGYIGHYHADPRLDPKKCDEIYASWAYRSCVLGEVADQVLVAVLNGSLAGFITLKMNASIEGIMILAAVRQDAQGSGIYTALVSAAKEWCFQKGAKRVSTSTQLPNRAVQKEWTLQGFWLVHAAYTFHKWFD
jgi:GNAT superfamily N-acetyltransferase